LKKTVVLACSVLLSCATTYHQMSTTGGYREAKLSEDTYMVTFLANAYTAPDAAAIYLEYRCAELTVQKGFDSFVRVSDTNMSAGVSAGMFGVVHKPGFNATIRMFKGEKPADPNALDARDVMKNLAPQIRR
jgi:hypothetical protein